MRDYIIHYKGISEGTHRFDFSVSDALFEHFPEGEVIGGELSVQLNLQKHSTFLELTFGIEGTVKLPCDRCLEVLSLPVSLNTGLVVKFSSGPTDTEDSEIWVLNTGEDELDLTHFIYESISLGVPLQRYHGIEGTKESDCDPNMVRHILMQEDTLAEPNIDETIIDPRWAKLGSLKN